MSIMASFARSLRVVMPLYRSYGGVGAPRHRSLQRSASQIPVLKLNYFAHSSTFSTSAHQEAEVRNEPTVTPRNSTTMKTSSKRDILLPESGPRLQYELLLEQGTLKLDRSQLRVVRALQRVYDNLKDSNYGELDNGATPRVTLVERARMAAESDAGASDAVSGSTLSQSVTAARNSLSQGSQPSATGEEKRRDLRLSPAELKLRHDLIAVDNVLYDLESFAPKHPGGDAIRMLKGTDATLAFYKLHPSHMVKRAKRRLETYKMGELIPDETEDQLSLKPEDVEVPDRGLYIYGGPGCGKTMLMDMFYHELDTDKKKRIHFHEFMVGVHRKLHKLKEKHNSQRNQSKGGPIGTTELFLHMADEFREECKVLCLDEFMVTDVADALIMRQLFDSFWRAGIVLVATSNRPTNELYKNGLQREVFLPFLEKLDQHCKPIQLRSELDYRVENTKRIRELLSVEQVGTDMEHHFYVRIKDVSSNHIMPNPKFDELWKAYTTPDTVVENASIMSHGRRFQVSLADMQHRVARISFDRLCADDTRPMGVADFAKIASTFDTVFVEDVPIISLEDLDTLRRFVSFIDVAYDQRVVLVMDLHAPVTDIIDMMGVTSEEDARRVVRKQADVMGDEYLAQTVHDLDNPGEVGYHVDSDAESVDEAFAVSRTLSRLVEMETEEYAKQCRKKRPPVRC